MESPVCPQGIVDHKFRSRKIEPDKIDTKNLHKKARKLTQKDPNGDDPHGNKEKQNDDDRCDDDDNEKDNEDNDDDDDDGVDEKNNDDDDDPPLHHPLPDTSTSVSVASISHCLHFSTLFYLTK